MVSWSSGFLPYRKTAKRLVEIAAVAGRQVGHDVLAEVCGMSEVDMSLALHEAVDAQLLVVHATEPIERYAFRHALVQEAAYDELLPSERRALHAAYARAMETRPAGGGAAEASRLVELAHHWTAANDPTRALNAVIAAGDSSRAVRADSEAASQYERAIQLWSAVPVGERPAEGRDLADLYHRASDAANRGRGGGSGGGPRSTGDGARRPRRGTRRYQRTASRRARAAHASDLAGGRLRDRDPSSRGGSRTLRSDPQSPGPAPVLGWLAGSLMMAGRFDESVPFAEARSGCASIDHPALEARATSLLAVDGDHGEHRPRH